MAGTASANLVFEPPIPFTQYDGDCDSDVVYHGAVKSIKKLDFGSFCVVDNIDTGVGIIEAYSRVDIMDCTAEKIFESWSKCDDSDCTNCVAEYKAFTNWGTIRPDPIVGHCFEYTFSVDDITKATRMVGTFEEVKEIHFNFDEDADAADAEAYVKMMDDNSCISWWDPSDTVDISKDADASDVDVSGASTLASTSVVAMAAGLAMILA